MLSFTSKRYSRFGRTRCLREKAPRGCGRWKFNSHLKTKPKGLRLLCGLVGEVNSIGNLLVNPFMWGQMLHSLRSSPRNLAQAAGYLGHGRRFTSNLWLQRSWVEGNLDWHGCRPRFCLMPFPGGSLSIWSRPRAGNVSCVESWSSCYCSFLFMAFYGLVLL